MPADWLVRVYASESDVDPCAKWTIEDRSEGEAEREAAQTISANYPEAEDWTMTRDA